MPTAKAMAEKLFLSSPEQNDDLHWRRQMNRSGLVLGLAAIAAIICGFVFGF
jgi:hypothetical protein